jgi:uncharacterized repeat protein (TIGR03803 family)
MRSKSSKFWLGLILLAAEVILLMMAGRSRAQSFTNLHQFTPLNSVFINDDGAFPTAGLTLTNNSLYGTTSQGGMAGGGTVFKINPGGTGFAVLYSFTPANPSNGAPGDGAYPFGGLMIAGNTLFGTTSAGGASDSGILFKVNIDGTGFATLHAFTAPDPNTKINADGAYPWAGLLLSGSTLYGTATLGGDSGSGTVYKLNTDGTGFTRLHSFSELDNSTGRNTDGAYPLGGLILWSNALYGTTYRGGALGTGTVYKVNIDGTGFVTLLSSDGGPRSSLLVISNSFYGTTEGGGSLHGGTVFKLNTDGSGFTNLQSFAGDSGNGPWAELILAGGSLCGTTYSGGDSGQGSVFSLNLDGTDFINLYSFASTSDGAHPQAPVTSIGDSLYGTASAGGSSGDGSIFKVGPAQGGQQQPTIVVSGGSAILSWPTNATGLILQSTTNLVSPIAWTPVTPGPVVVNGFNIVTNPIASSAMFYRLGQ